MRMVENAPPNDWSAPDKGRRVDVTQPPSYFTFQSSRFCIIFWGNLVRCWECEESASTIIHHPCQAVTVTNLVLYLLLPRCKSWWSHKAWKNMLKMLGNPRDLGQGTESEKEESSTGAGSKILHDHPLSLTRKMQKNQTFEELKIAIVLWITGHADPGRRICPSHPLHAFDWRFHPLSNLFSYFEIWIFQGVARQAGPSDER